MKPCDYQHVRLTDGFARKKQLLNERVTIDAIYQQFSDTGRFRAFNFNWREGMPEQPHIFWDSDIAKWFEAAAYSLNNHQDEALQDKMEAVIDQIEKFQGHDGYFNIWFTVVEPAKRFSNRTQHELYCAGHLMEAAVAYAEVTGRERFLHLMEKYALYIRKVFIEEDSAKFRSPGHEEIELALVKMYRYTGKKVYLDMAAHFINMRGSEEDIDKSEYNQSHLPVREQKEAVGHSVRAMYLYIAMADLALELQDEELKKACRTLFESVTKEKMYVTGGIGSCYIGETFSKPYDLPNAEAYTETCAGIGLLFFCDRLLRLENRAEYADVMERLFYNGILSGLSLDGKHFFYENPLEITLQDHFKGSLGEKRYPITQRPEVFRCSCCPPNVSRLLASIQGYVYGLEEDVLFVNQFTGSILDQDNVKAEMKTDYPVDGRVALSVSGVKKAAIRIPDWCDRFTIGKSYELRDGYAYVEVDHEGDCIDISFDMTPFAVQANRKITRDANRYCIQAGPVVYCAEEVDNGENLQSIRLEKDFTWNATYEEAYGLNCFDISAFRTGVEGPIYGKAKGNDEVPVTLHLIPYYAFANRGESDMLVWFNRK